MPKERLMTKQLYQMQEFFERICEYTFDTHEDAEDILKKMFPDNAADVDKKLEYLRDGKRSFTQPFTSRDDEMERFIANNLKG